MSARLNGNIQYDCLEQILSTRKCKSSTQVAASPVQFPKLFTAVGPQAHFAVNAKSCRWICREGIQHLKVGAFVCRVAESIGPRRCDLVIAIPMPQRITLQI